MNKAAIIFDLDMTLIDSSRLEQFRDHHNWQDVRKNLDWAKPFDFEGVKPHKLPGLLKEKGYPVAIVTSSPGWYAKALINKFGIICDVLVAYGDTQRHKPAPDPICLALDRLGYAAESAYHIGDDVNDVEASYQAGVVSIGAGWGIRKSEIFAGTAPDILYFEPDLLLEPKNFELDGYLLEMEFASKCYLVHDGAVLKCHKNGPRVFALGRYFPAENPRHISSQLSKKLIDLKDNPSSLEVFAKSIAMFIEHILAKEGIDPSAITCVPPKPEQFNRFLPIFDNLRRLVDTSIDLVPDGLFTTRPIVAYKTLGAEGRKVIISGAYESKRKWQGQVLLIDDVCTTGATLCECVKVVKESGAEDIVPLVFGMTQQYDSLKRKICSVCGRPMKIRKNRYYGNRFWGCTGYPKYCIHTENLES